MDFNHFLLITFLCCFTYNFNPLVVVLAQAKHHQIQSPNSDGDLPIHLALKSSIISDPTNFLSNWSSSKSNASYCSWAGVSCNSNKRVIYLNLSSSNLEGNLNANVGKLVFLTSLDLSYNYLNGFIPIELGSLKILRSLNLAYNNFTGNIPSSLGNLSQLEFLHLQNNSLSGTIPVSLGDLSKLHILELGFNFLEGNIPQQFRNLSNLRILSLESNGGLNGGLPTGMFNNMSSLQEIGLANNGFSGSILLDICTYVPNLRVIDMSVNQFEGPIPSELYKCKALEVVSFSYNKFNSFPKEIGYLTNLKELYLGGNSFTSGGIPSEIGNLRQLQSLGIESSLLSGEIPPSIFNLSSLTTLNLSNNTLTGEIPLQFGNLTSLQDLYLSYNNLTGNLPIQIAALRHLQHFSVSYNFLQGSVPPEILNITSLISLGVEGNNFSGHLPSTMWTTLPNIQRVYLSGNDFTGTIPSSINNASNLVFLEIIQASLSGTIPTTIGDLKYLQKLILGENNLTGESWTRELRFITALTRCRNLQLVELSLNQFNGYLPNSFGNFSSSLISFNIFGSKLIGRIPSEIGNLTSLESINMDSNEFTGFIPSTIGKMARLDRIYLEHNRLQGSIPNELCNLKNLGDLYLNDNMLSGSIPSCLCELTSLRRVYLHSNNLSSTIPMSIWNLNYLLELSLSMNALTGVLPLEIQNLRVITALDLSWNQFSGEIPNTIGSAQSLVRMSLAHNQFDGNIPQSFGNSLSLEALDLSDNRFSGTIPTSLEDLKYLEMFNVSSNQLEGRIPSGGSFSNFTDQSFLDNPSLCGGSERMHFPPCQSNKGSRSKALKSILPPVASVVLIAAALVFLWLRSRRKHKEVLENDITLPSNLKRTSYYELLRATDSFNESCLLGTGGFGSVYKATLADGSIVAVKVFNMQSDASEKSFDAECEVLASIRHRNLVKILGCCVNLDCKALILDYMPNGNLETWLHSDRNLDLVDRLNIAIDVAEGLEYLHHDHIPAVVHCDLKPSNILLDESKVAHLCDFGISKLLDEEGESMVRTKTLATIGYMAPEYGADGIVSTYGDVYSYGVILLEMVTGKSPTDDIFIEGFSLKSWVEKSIQENSIMEVVDMRLMTTTGGEDIDLSAKEICFSSLCELAMECLSDMPHKRMSMRKITPTVRKIKHLLSNP